MRDLKTEVQVLHGQHQQQQTNEIFLKNVIKNLATFYGQESIQRAIEVASYESSMGSDSEHAYQDMSCESSYEPKKEVPYYAYDPINSQSEYAQNAVIPSYEPCEPTYVQKPYGYASHDAFGQLVKGNPTRVNKNHVYDEISQESLELPQDFQAQGIFDDDECDSKVDNDKSSSSDTYMSWYMEFEKNQMNADAFLGSHANAGNRDNGNLDIDSSLSTENQLYMRADF
jgi:hypothetical protein